MKTWIPAAALLVALLAWSAHAEDESVEVADLVHTFELDASVDAVWKAFTTDELAAKWMAPVVQFDLRSGGTFKTNYDKAAGIGGPGTIVHHIQAVQAPHLLVARTEAPEGNPFRGVVETLTGTWRFESLAADRTRITLGMHGWPQTARGAEVRAFFARANPMVLKKLEALFPPRPSTADAMKRMQRILGTYDGTLEVGGRTLIIRKEIRRGPGGHGLECKTSFGAEGQRRVHKHELVWLEQPTGRVAFRALDAQGGSVGGVLRCDGEHDVIWDFEEKGQQIRMRMDTKAADGHRFSVAVRGEDGAYAEQFAVAYKRAP